MSEESLALTTTSAFLRMFEAWWLEFKLKDGRAGTLQHKLKSLFKGSGVSVSLKPYESGDGFLAFDPQDAPPASYAWLPSPPKKVELVDGDLLFFERQSRISLRALNFVEVILQTWKNGDLQDDTLMQMQHSLSRAVKCITQAQIASLCGLIQLRRDHCLATAKGLSVDDLQALRHAPLLGMPSLFPEATLRELNEKHHKALQTKALMQSTSKKEPSSQRKPDTRSKPAYDDFAPHWSVSHVDVLPVVGASCSGPPPASGCPGDSSTICPPDESSRFIENTQQAEVLLPHTSPVPQEFSDTGVSGDSFAEERALISAQAHIPVGGKLQFFWRNWKVIKASKRVVRWCRKGYRLPFAPDGERAASVLLRTVCPPDRIPHYRPGTPKHLALTDMITVLLEKHVIEPVSTGRPCFFNIVFLRPKPNGSWRLILDVSSLNEFLVVHKFSMDTPQVIRNTVPPDTWVTSIDFSDAFHHLLIHPHYRHFLAFHFAGHTYQYCACPFGLSPIPQVFTELCSPVKAFARQTWRCIVFQYIDDWLFASSDAARTLQITHLFIQLCLQLGLTVNLDKSHLTPTQHLCHLGVQWDFHLALVRPPDDKLLDVRRITAQLLHTSEAPIPLLESLMGKLVAMEKLVPYGRLHYRAFQWFLLRMLRRHGRSFVKVLLDDSTRVDLQWWTQRVQLKFHVPFRPLPPHHVIYTDASRAGWGASSANWTLSGTWSPVLRRSHINVLEMLAVLNTITLKGALLRNSVVQVCSDNLSVVYYINKQGGTRSPPLMDAVSQVLRLAERLQLTLRASYIRGDLNVIADMLSRAHTVLRTEWRLSSRTFAWVSQQSPWGPPTVDLFAHRFNSQLPRYLSACPDTDAVGVDALLCRWPQEVCYAFPPATLLQQVCVKILQERPRTLLLVASHSPTTHWFPTLQQW